MQYNQNCYSEAEVLKLMADLKEGYILSHSRESDPDPYGGGAHWENELFFDSATQKFYNLHKFWASQYNHDPEKEVTTEMIETRVLEILTYAKKWSISVSINKRVPK